MSARGPLAGRTIVVTRPREQAGPLAEAIAAAGGTPLLFPLLEISPVPDREALEAAVEQLGDYSIAVFISPNAVEHALPAIHAAGPWPAGLRPAAVGPSTVKALAAQGVGRCLVPTVRFDSEALLELPELAEAEVKGRRIVIFRGDGGRELLADTLRRRGAVVDGIACYQRSGPAGGSVPLMQAWRAGRLDALTVSSSEGLRHLVGLLDVEGLAFLRSTPIFVPHARIADNARALGLDKIILSEAADVGIMAALGAYNWAA